MCVQHERKTLIHSCVKGEGDAENDMHAKEICIENDMYARGKWRQKCYLNKIYNNRWPCRNPMEDGGVSLVKEIHKGCRRFCRWGWSKGAKGYVGGRQGLLLRKKTWVG